MVERKRLVVSSSLLISFLIALLFIGATCGGTTDPKPPSDTLTDFTYTDNNPFSASYEQQLAPGGLSNKTLVLFCGEIECSVCVRQYKGLHEAITTLNGKTDLVVGWMINYATDDGTDTSKLLLNNITQPVLQDTMTLHEGINTPACTALNKIYSRDLLLVRPDLTIYRRSSCGTETEYEINLETQAGKDALLGWLSAMTNED